MYVTCMCIDHIGDWEMLCLYIIIPSTISGDCAVEVNKIAGPHKHFLLLFLHRHFKNHSMIMVSVQITTFTITVFFLLVCYVNILNKTDFNEI